MQQSGVVPVTLAIHGTAIVLDVFFMTFSLPARA